MFIKNNTYVSAGHGRSNDLTTKKINKVWKIIAKASIDMLKELYFSVGQITWQYRRESANFQFGEGTFSMMERSHCTPAVWVILQVWQSRSLTHVTPTLMKYYYANKSSYQLNNNEKKHLLSIGMLRENILIKYNYMIEFTTIFTMTGIWRHKENVLEFHLNTASQCLSQLLLRRASDF